MNANQKFIEFIRKCEKFLLKLVIIGVLIGAAWFVFTFIYISQRYYKASVSKYCYFLDEGFPKDFAPGIQGKYANVIEIFKNCTGLDLPIKDKSRLKIMLSDDQKECLLNAQLKVYSKWDGSKELSYYMYSNLPTNPDFDGFQEGNLSPSQAEKVFDKLFSNEVPSFKIDEAPFFNFGGNIRHYYGLPNKGLLFGKVYPTREGAYIQLYSSNSCGWLNRTASGSANPSYVNINNNDLKVWKNELESGLSLTEH